MSAITRLGAAPGVRRLVQKPPTPPGEVREQGDGEDPADVLCCVRCRRDLLPGVVRCAECGAAGVTYEARARLEGQLPVIGNPILSTGTVKAGDRKAPAPLEAQPTAS